MNHKPRSIWTPLARPLFRSLWIASVVSHIGSYMTDVAQGWLMTTLAPSPLYVSLLYTADSLPFFLLGLPAGALADILDRRLVLMVTQVAMAAVLATLAVVTLTGVVTPWLILLLATALGIAGAFNDPAWQSSVPEVLPQDELEAGVTLSSLGINVGRTLGPALGGFVVAAAGPGVVFVLDALTFLGVVVALSRWGRERYPTALPAEHMMGAISAGLRFARHSGALRRVLTAAFTFMLCGSGIMALMPVLARETGHGAVAFGLLLGSFGTGALTGGLLLPRLRARLGASLLTVGAAALAVVAGSTAAVRELALLCPLMALGGVAWISVLSTLNVAAQNASPPWMKARALAVYLIVFQAAVAAGSALSGVIASGSGLGTAYTGIGIGLAMTAALARWLRLGADEVVDFTPTHHWADPVVAGEPALEAGPIMIQVEYRVDPGKAAAFASAMAAVGKVRRRDGALQWWLFQDVADPERFVETWIATTWAEHLRNHERASAVNRDVEQRAIVLTRSGAATQVRHFVVAPLGVAGTSRGGGDSRANAPP